MESETVHGSLDAALQEIEEPIESRALVEYQRRGPSSPDRWGLLLLTGTGLYVVYGKGQTIVRRLLNASAPEHRSFFIPFSSIATVRIPPHRGLLERLCGGPTRVATITRRHEDPVRLTVDKQGERLLEEAMRRTNRRGGGSQKADETPPRA